MNDGQKGHKHSYFFKQAVWDIIAM